jgi:IMP dehydrogenase
VTSCSCAIIPEAAKGQCGQITGGSSIGYYAGFDGQCRGASAVGVDIVTLDSAHGHSKGVIQALKALRKNFKNLPIIAGNM